MAFKRNNFTPKTKEERQKELDLMLEKSLGKIKNYHDSPEDIIEFADFMSKIHNYSITNVSLIEDQFKGARAVASFDDWKKRGYNVLKGEKGIQIYAYTPITKFLDENKEYKQLNEATPEQKAKIKTGELESVKLDSFKKGYVYDISQTSASPEDLPKIFPNKVWDFKIEGEQNLENLQKGIGELASSNGIEIKDMRELDVELGASRGVYRQYTDGRDIILLNSRNTATQDVAVSIHELAHKKLHNNERMKNLPQIQKEYGMGATSIKEFQAELTSYIVCKNYGIDTSDEAIRYIAKWTDNAQHIPPQILKDVLKDVRDTSHEFISEIDNVIIKEREAKQNHHQKLLQEQDANVDPTIKNTLENDVNQLKEKTVVNSTENDYLTKIVNVKNNELINDYRALMENQMKEYPDFITHEYFAETAEDVAVDYYKVGKSELSLYVLNDKAMLGITDHHLGESIQFKSFNLDQVTDKKYLDEFVIKTVSAYEKERTVESKSDELTFYQDNKDAVHQINSLKPENMNTLRSAVLEECISVLSENPTAYASESNWYEDLDSQLEFTHLTQLNTCVSPEKFYKTHQVDIENTLDNLEKVTQNDIRGQIKPEQYRAEASLIAYKSTVTLVQDNIKNGVFKIPQIQQHSLEKDEVKSSSNSIRSDVMEIG